MIENAWVQNISVHICADSPLIAPQGLHWPRSTCAAPPQRQRSTRRCWAAHPHRLFCSSKCDIDRKMCRSIAPQPPELPNGGPRCPASCRMDPWLSCRGASQPRKHTGLATKRECVHLCSPHQTNQSDISLLAGFFCQ